MHVHALDLGVRIIIDDQARAAVGAKAQPSLDDEQGARAYLKPLQGVAGLLAPWKGDAPALRALDKVVDALCGDGGDGSRLWERTSRTRVDPRDVMLMSIDHSAPMLAAAVHCGFFPFAS